MSKSKSNLSAKLYGIPGSNATRVTRLMLDYKGIPYKLVTLPTGAHRDMVRAMGFPNKSVPAVKLAGRKLQGTRVISRALEEIRPDPPLFPADPDLRQRVEDAERWGDEVLQDIPRRITFSNTVRKNAKSDYASYMEGPLLGMPPKMAVASAGPALAMTSRRVGQGNKHDELARAAVAAVPEVIDHIDNLIADGTIGGPQLNAADFQIAASVRLLMTLDDLRPFIAAHQAGQHATRLVPDYPGKVRPVLPADWLLVLRDDAVQRTPGA